MTAVVAFCFQTILKLTSCTQIQNYVVQKKILLEAYNFLIAAHKATLQEDHWIIDACMQEIKIAAYTM
jgi:hypothetical protein